MNNIKTAFLTLACMLLLQGAAQGQVIEEVVCPGNDYCIELDSMDGTTQWQESTDGMSFSDISGAMGISYCQTPTLDTAWYRAQSVVAGCTIYSDTIRLIRSQLLVFAGNDATFCDGESYILGGNPTATGSLTYTYDWSPSTGLNDATLSNPTATPNTTTDYTLTVTDNDGCTATDEVTLTVIPVPTDTIEYIFTGQSQFFVFPQCVDQVSIEVWGAQGGAGAGTNPGDGGLGGYAAGDLSYDTSLGDTIHLFVGGTGVAGGAGGTGGWNGGGDGGDSQTNPGGGGGGASDVRYGGAALGDRMMVAGGGGGGGGSSEGGLSAVIAGAGGDAGALNNANVDGGGLDGDATNVSPSNCVAPGGGGGFWAASTGLPVFGQNNLGQAQCGCGAPGDLPSGNPDPVFNSIGGDGGAGTTSGACPGQGSGGGGGGGGYGAGAGAGGAMGDNVSTNAWPAGGGGGGGSYYGPAILNGTVLIPSSGNQGSGKITISY